MKRNEAFILITTFTRICVK